MNLKQLTILLVLVVVLGITGLYIYKNQNAGSKDANPALGQKLLAKLPINDVTSVTVKQGANEMNLVKTDELWRVRERNNYAANFSEIKEFLVKMRDLKAVQTEAVGASQLPRLWLTPGSGTNSAVVVELKGQGDKSLATILMGKKHMRKSTRPSPMGDMGGDEGWPDGRYVKVGSGDTVALVSETFQNVEPKPEQWLDKDFFKVEKVRSIAVIFPNATNSWQLSRETETGEWKLADAKPQEQLDSGKTSGLASALSSPSFSDVAGADTAAQFGLDKPTLVNLETFDDFAYNLKVGTKTNDNYPLNVAVSARLPKERTAGKDEKPEDKEKLDKEFKEKQQKLEEKLGQEKAYENWIYLVSSWSLDSLLKERAQLMAEKKEEPKKEDNATSQTGTNSPPFPGLSVAEPGK
jgi:hypothetical protein